MAKRPRTSKQPFEQGVNPPRAPRASQAQPSPKRRRHSTHYTTPKRARRAALATLPSTVRRSPELSQSAVVVQALEPSIDEEDDNIEEVRDGTELPEVVEVDDGPPPWQPLYLSSDIELRDPELHIRWRAGFGDMEKNPILSAFNTARKKKLSSLNSLELWSWAEEVVDELKPRKVKMSSLCAIVYPARQPKRDRSIMRLRSNNMDDFYEFDQLVKSVDFETSEVVHVDFDLLLYEELNEPSQPTVPSSSARSRPITATTIQEHGLAGIIAAEQAGSGHAIAIRDQWRCTDTSCSNYPYTCWTRAPAGRQARFDDHYPVNGNTIVIWAREVDTRTATYTEPSDNVRLAILRAKDKAIQAKTRRRKNSPTSSDDGLKTLTKLLIAGQLSQMNRQLQQPVNEAAINLSGPVTSAPSGWVPIEYTHPVEMNEHTINFFDYLKAEFAEHHETIDLMFTKSCVTGAMDINMLMDESDRTMRLWTEHFHLAPGWLITIHQYAKKWQKSYTGLGERSWRRVDRAQKREERLRQRILDQRKSSVLSEDVE